MTTPKSLDDPFYQRLRTFLDATNAETDRGRALVSASVIEEMLEEILRGFLMECPATQKLFNSAYAPFSTFSAKILACRSLGLISSEEYEDIECLRKIRNEFAHSILCSFRSPKVERLARELKVGMSEIDSLNGDDTARIGEPQRRFAMVTTSIVVSLYNRAYHVRSNRLEERDWPS